MLRIRGYPQGKGNFCRLLRSPTLFLNEVITFLQPYSTGHLGRGKSRTNPCTSLYYNKTLAINVNDGKSSAQSFSTDNADSSINFKTIIPHLKRSVPLSLIVSKYTKVSPSYSHGAKSFQCVCPFHDDKNPSMSISDSKVTL
jgi:hypothetical protein